MGRSDFDLAIRHQQSKFIRTALGINRTDQLLKQLTLGLIRFRYRGKLFSQWLSSLLKSVVARGDRRLVGGQVERHAIGELHCGKERAEAVMIGLRDRIMFVVMATAAGECQTE